jgi:hypothetical protein
VHSRTLVQSNIRLPAVEAPLILRQPPETAPSS